MFKYEPIWRTIFGSFSFDLGPTVDWPHSVKGVIKVLVWFVYWESL